MFVRFLFWTILACPFPLTTFAAEPSVVTNAQAVLSALGARTVGTPFSLTGHVIIPPSTKDMPFKVDVDGFCLSFVDRHPCTAPTVRPGDIVQILGTIEQPPAFTKPNLFCRELTIRGHEPLPAAAPIETRLFLSGAYNLRYVTLHGVITDILPDDLDERFVILALSDGNETVYIHYHSKTDPEPSTIRALIGKRVAVRGIGQNNWGKRRYAGPTLQIAGLDAIRVIRQDGPSPFDVPDIPAAESGNLSAGRLQVLKAHGTVIARWRGDSFLIRTEDGGTVQVETSEKPLPGPGKCVEAAGHLETDLIDLYLTRAFWRTLPASARQPPEGVTDLPLRKLFKGPSGSLKIDLSYRGRVIRVRGTVKNIATDRSGFRKMLIADGDHSILVDCSSVPDAVERLGEGFGIEVTGVCIKESDLCRPGIALPKVRGIFLLPRTADDIRVLRTPSWWTPARLLISLAFLIAIIVAILVWNALLRLMVARKSRALLREQTAKIGETLRIGERTSLAAELHDYLAQNLTVVAYQLTAAQAALGDRQDDLAASVNAAARMLKSCRTDLRRCLWDLRSDVLDETDFAKAIEKTVRPITGKSTLTVRFEGKRSDLSDSTAQTVLSVLRELAANAVNHGRAKTIRIAGECRDSALRFSVRDDGCGFDPATADQNSGHFGLNGIRERLTRLNGALTIESSPGQGTYVRLTIHPTSKEIPVP